MAVRKSRNHVADYFAVLVNYGGEIMPRGRMIDGT
jgi:hypothetical protein